MSDERVDAFIVSTEKRAEYANFLGQLIQAKSDLTVAVWEEKHWESNKPNVASSQKVIFLGKAGDDNQVGIEWYFDKHEMKYGWLKNRCVIAVDTIRAGQTGKFKEYYKERVENYKHLESEAKGGKLKWFGLLGGWLTGPVWFIAGSHFDRAKYKKYQYQLVVCEFVLGGGFDKFMEE